MDLHLCTHSTDDFYKSEITRVIRSHNKLYGIHLDCFNKHQYEELLKRRPDTGFTYKEPKDISDRMVGYTKAFKGIRHYKVDLAKEPSGFISEDTIKEIEKKIGIELCG